ncbi:MAG: M15 family metallopeptidase [Treponemataceae bacterium]|nr:M15 family metallopeptidase [Treponemataceae bacterium]
MSKKWYFLPLLLAFVVSVSCADSASEKERLLESVVESLEIPSARIILENKQQFLNDLDVVLAADTDYLLTLVDKRHFLSQDYKPEDLVALKANNHYAINRNDLSLRLPVEKALQVMSDAAAKDGVSVLVSSTFRSYEYQKNLYARNVKQLGQAVADRESAKPGTSQHQLGTAIDFGSITDDFIDTKLGKWLAKNGMKYGFSLSFPDGYEDVTGYRYECWHYRYIGVEACKMQQKWFGNIQQYMLEFIYAWEKANGQ